MSNTTDMRRGNGWSRGGFEMPKEIEPEICPNCGQPLGHRPLWMVGKYDVCFSCFESRNVSELDQTNPAEKAYLLEKAIAEQDRINQEERERRVQQIFPHPNRRVGDNDLGTHVIISGGEILELGEQKGTDIPF